MIYLLIFYWIFAALFCFGAVYAIAKLEEKNIFVIFVSCLVIGGILFPMYFGRNLHLEQYEYYRRKKELSDFLISVKNRVQPQSKQEWTEEDKKCIRLSTDIIDSALRAGFCVQLDRDRCIDWLKSLKPQNKWKPSDEQMQALKEACDKHWEPDGLHPLFTLYEQLKQL